MRVASGADDCKAPRRSQGRYLGEERNDAGAAPDATRQYVVSFEGPWRFGPMAAPAPPCVGRLHGVLAALPSARIAAVAHVRIDQSFPRANCTCSRSWRRISRPPAIIEPSIATDWMFIFMARFIGSERYGAPG